MRFMSTSLLEVTPFPLRIQCANVPERTAGMMMMVLQIELGDHNVGIIIANIKNTAKPTAIDTVIITFDFIIHPSSLLLS